MLNCNRNVLEDNLIKIYDERKQRYFILLNILEVTLRDAVYSCVNKAWINAYKSSTMDIYKYDLLLSLRYEVRVILTLLEDKFGWRQRSRLSERL